MKYLYENKEIEEIEVRKILLEKGLADVKMNLKDYVKQNCSFEESDVNIAINGSIKQVLDYLADYNIEIKETQFNKYQGVVLLDVNIPLKRLQEVINKIREIVYNLTEVDNLGIRKLAYEIKGNKEAYYIEFSFEDKPKNIKELEEYFQKNDDILKFIIIRNQEG